jgi:hypothetical protein
MRAAHGDDQGRAGVDGGDVPLAGQVDGVDGQRRPVDPRELWAAPVSRHPQAGGGRREQADARELHPSE